MPLFHLVVLALVQGITEFLPISSSAHLILVPALTGWEDQGLLLDVSVHMGTLAAVLCYFWRDTRGLFLAGLSGLGISPARRAIKGTRYIQLFWSLVLATLPVIMAGLAMRLAGLDTLLRSPLVIALASIGFGALLYFIDQRSVREKTIGAMALKPALMIGLAQILALIPGTSRAGITMTAARHLGFKRPDAAHFSMLLAIPTILAAGGLATTELIDQGVNGLWRDALIAGALAFFAALAAIRFLMVWLSKASMTVFVIYRVLLGIALLLWIAI